jgi:hypothetical protein
LQITAVKSFITLAPGATFVSLFFQLLTNVRLGLCLLLRRLRSISVDIKLRLHVPFGCAFWLFVWLPSEIAMQNRKCSFRGLYFKTFFSAVFKDFRNKLEYFVSGKSLQPSLMFGGKAEAYLSEAPLRGSTLW